MRARGLQRGSFISIAWVFSDVYVDGPDRIDQCLCFRWVVAEGVKIGSGGGELTAWIIYRGIQSGPQKIGDGALPGA